jgi:hypothetical protein
VLKANYGRRQKTALAAESKNERNTPYKQTARDAYRTLIATDPRFKEAPKTGLGFGIVGARPK